MSDELKDEIKKEEKTFNILLIAVLSPILLGAVVITIYLLNYWISYKTLITYSQISILILGFIILLISIYFVNRTLIEGKKALNEIKNKKK